MKFKESKKVELKKSTAQLKQALKDTGIQPIDNTRNNADEKTTTQETTQKSAEKVRSKCGESAELIFAVIKENKFIKTHEMVEKTGLSQRTVENAIAKLKKAKFLKREGSPKSGHW